MLDRLFCTEDGNLPPAFARQILAFEFTEEEQCRAQELGEKAQLGTLTSTERGELEELVATNDIACIMQSKARRSLGMSLGGK